MTKCPYCGEEFKNYNGLSKHIFKYKAHGRDITKEKLLCDVNYGGKRQKCKCGCGEYTEIGYNGGIHFNDYVRGHQSRVHNNWGHNEKAKINSANTRKNQFIVGSRRIWNKGKKWKDCYTDEKISELKEKIYNNSERNRKISKSLKEICNKEDHKLMMHDRMVNLICSNNNFKISSSKEEEFIEEVIKPLGIEFEKQYYIKDINQYCDIYIPSKNAIIEFNGDFWHANPTKYDRSNLYESQKRKVSKDKIKSDYCKNNGINLIVVWESDYKENKEDVITKIKNKITLL